jgi:hypothetical protein
MRLIAKIFPHYFKEILDGEKKEEFRQLEEIVFVNSRTGEELTYEIKGIFVVRPEEVNKLKETFPDVKWKENLVTVQINLGERIGSILKPKVIE